MQANLKGITHPCPYCEMDGRNPTPEQFALHKLHHNPMSNSTQNKVFNDLPEKDQKEIIRGAMKHAKKLQDEILNTKKQISNEVDAVLKGRNIRIISTQNDMADKTKEKVINILGYDHMLHNENCHLCNVAVNNIVNLLADARREVIKRIESMPDKDVRPEITVWLEPKEYCLGYNKALQDVLATLREEEGRK